MINITDINSQDFGTFVEKFNNVVEHSPFVAGTLWKMKPFHSVDHFVLNTFKTIYSLPTIMQEGILRLYPDLAGHLADDGQLGLESTLEHSAANLDQLTYEEKTQMADLNQKYKDKFGFPFVICARMNKKDAILSGLKARLNNSQEHELQNGIREVMKICELRIRDLIYDDNKHTSKL